MDGVSSLSSALPLLSSAATAGSATDTSGSSDSSASIGPAASLELSVLQLQGQMMSTLFASMPVSSSPSSMFAGGSMLSLLNAQGSAAMAYLTPQAAQAGSNLNALA